MVNYCCVQNCSRNSRDHKHLNFHSLPRDRFRQKQWLKLIGKEDLLNKDMDKLRKKIRFCSRHFPPNCIANKHLSQDALPIKSLPGSPDEDEPDREPEKHEGILCDSCQDPILGFRYKCVTCDNFDLCQKCEMLERHSQHYMLRIPKSVRFQIANDLLNEWRNLFKPEPVTPDCATSSDDEPVTKYIRNYDSGIDLTEDVKKEIRNEIRRTLKVVKENEDRAKLAKKSGAIKRKESTVDIVPNKRQKEADTEVNRNIITQAGPELVFADVNAVKFDHADVKPEGVNEDVQNSSMTEQSQPLLYVTLSNDLSQFMIKLDSNGDESIVKELLN